MTEEVEGKTIHRDIGPDADNYLIDVTASGWSETMREYFYWGESNEGDQE